jgi:hypothetical protein
MHVAVAMAMAALVLLAASNHPSDARCITEPVDKSERAEALRKRAIRDFVDGGVIYRIARTSETAVEVQITARFLELPFDKKQVVAWAVFSSNFDGADDKQNVVFIDTRNLKHVGEFDACHGLTLR